MGHIQIIEDRNAWGKIIEQFDEADFYHSYDYHLISRSEDEKPVLISYQEGDKVIALPLLIRDIEGTSLKDATSVYGYCGPIGKNIPQDFDNETFKKEINTFLKDNDIVSVFSRLHPFIPSQNSILKGIGDIVPHGHVVNIDLKKSLEAQKQQYNRRLRTYINKEVKEYDIISGSSNECVDIFINAYCQNMKRVNAKPHYFFKREYFYELLASPQINAELLMARHKQTGDLAGGAVFTKKNGFVQYHLSGVKEEYLELNPIKLIIDHIRIKSSNEGFSYLNLGGGLGGHDYDSLFYFKSGFSKEYRRFFSWQYIVNKKKYLKLVRQQKELHPRQPCYYTPYFPQYRCDLNKSNTGESENNCWENDK
ncbi:GNAT family N-acetyltransferase [Flagellimonas iocasae]|uniref:GNAT family N-acetyltransferase n=1 Tax=Flagellimonas iocasae TaxID=2055905 RepID=A0ABW4XTD1_9FLAO